MPSLNITTTVTFTPEELYGNKTKKEDVGINCGKLNLPLVGAILAPLIRASKLYNNNDYWKPHKYLDANFDKLVINITNPFKYVVYRYRYYNHQQADEQNNIRSELRFSKLELEIILDEELTAFMRAVIAKNVQWSYKVTPNFILEHVPGIENPVKFPSIIPDNFYGLKIQTHGYNHALKVFMLMPIKTHERNLFPHDYETLITKYKISEIFLLLIQAELSLKQSFYLWEEQKKSLISIKAAINNTLEGCLDAEIFGMFKEVFIFRIKLQNSFYFFNRDTVSKQIMALGTIEKTLGAVINGERSYLRVLITLDSVLESNGILGSNQDLNHLLINMQRTLQARNTQSIQLCKAPNAKKEFRELYLALFYPMRISCTYDLKIFFGDYQACYQLLNEIRLFLENIAIDDSQFELIQRIFLDCFHEFTEKKVEGVLGLHPENQLRNDCIDKVDEINITLKGLKESKYLLDKFEQIKKFSGQDQILIHVSSSINKLLPTPENKVAIKVFLTWLFEKHIKSFDKQDMFNSLLENKLINCLLAEKSTREKLIASRIPFFRQIENWLNKHITKDKQIEPIVLLRELIPDFFKVKYLRDLLVERSVKLIESGEQLRILHRLSALKKAIPEEFHKPSKVLDLDVHAIKLYLTIIPMSASNKVATEVNRIVKIIIEQSLENPVCEDALTHVKFNDIYKDHEGFLAKIISCKIEHYLHLKDKSESLAEIKKILSNQHCFELLIGYPDRYSNYRVYEELNLLIIEHIKELLVQNELDEIYESYLHPDAKMMQFLSKLQLFEQLKKQLNKVIIEHAGHCTKGQYIQLFYSNIRESFSYSVNTKLMQEKIVAESKIEDHHLAIRKDLRALLPTSNNHDMPSQFELFIRLTQQGQNEFNALLTEENRIKLNDELTLIYLFSTILQAPARQKELEKFKDQSFKKTIHLLFSTLETETTFQLIEDCTCQKALEFQHFKLDTFALHGVVLMLDALRRSNQLLFESSITEPCNLVELAHCATDEEIQFAECAKLLKDVNTQELLATHKIKLLTLSAENKKIPIIMPLTRLWICLQQKVIEQPKSRASYKDTATAFPSSMPNYQEFLTALESESNLKEFSDKRLSFSKACEMIEEDYNILFTLNPILQNLFCSTKVNNQFKTISDKERLSYRALLKRVLEKTNGQDHIAINFLQELIACLSRHAFTEYNTDAFYENLENATEAQCLFLYMMGNDEQRINVATQFFQKIMVFKVLNIQHTPIAILEQDFSAAFCRLPDHEARSVSKNVVAWIQGLITAQVPLDNLFIFRLAEITKAHIATTRRNIVIGSNNEAVPLTPTSEKIQTFYTDIIEKINLHNGVCLKLIKMLKNEIPFNEAVAAQFINLHAEKTLPHNVPTYSSLLATLRDQCNTFINKFLKNALQVMVNSYEIDESPPNLQMLNSVAKCFRQLENLENLENLEKKDHEHKQLKDIENRALETIKDALTPIPLRQQSSLSHSFKKLKNAFAGHYIYCFANENTKEWMIKTVEQAIRQYWLMMMYHPAMHEHALKYSQQQNTTQGDQSPLSEQAKIQNIIQFICYLPSKAIEEFSFMQRDASKLLKLQFLSAFKLSTMGKNELFVALLRYTVYAGIFGTLLDSFQKTVQIDSKFLESKNYKALLRLFWQTPVPSEAKVRELIKSTSIPECFLPTFIDLSAVLLKCAQVSNAVEGKLEREPFAPLNIESDITHPLSNALNSYGQNKISLSTFGQNKVSNKISQATKNTLEISDVLKRLRLIVDSLGLLLGALNISKQDSVQESIIEFLRKCGAEKTLYNGANHWNNLTIIILLRIVYSDVQIRRTLSNEGSNSSALFKKQNLGVSENQRCFSKLLDSIRKLDITFGKQVLCPLQTELLSDLLKELYKPLNDEASNNNSARNNSSHDKYEPYLNKSDEMYNLYLFLFGLLHPNIRQLSNVHTLSMPNALINDKQLESGSYFATKNLIKAWIEEARCFDATLTLKTVNNYRREFFHLLEFMQCKELNELFYSMYKVKLTANLNALLAGAWLFVIGSDNNYISFAEDFRIKFKTDEQGLIQTYVNKFHDALILLIPKGMLTTQQERQIIHNAIIFIQDYGDKIRKLCWELLLKSTPNDINGSVLLRTILQHYEPATPRTMDFDELKGRLNTLFFVNDFRRENSYDEQLELNRRRSSALATF